MWTDRQHEFEKALKADDVDAAWASLNKNQNPRSDLKDCEEDARGINQVAGDGRSARQNLLAHETEKHRAANRAKEGTCPDPTKDRKL